MPEELSLDFHPSLASLLPSVRQMLSSSLSLTRAYTKFLMALLPLRLPPLRVVLCVHAVSATRCVLHDAFMTSPHLPHPPYRCFPSHPSIDRRSPPEATSSGLGYPVSSRSSPCPPLLVIPQDSSYFSMTSPPEYVPGSITIGGGSVPLSTGLWLKDAVAAGGVLTDVLAGTVWIIACFGAQGGG